MAEDRSPNAKSTTRVSTASDDSDIINETFYNLDDAPNLNAIIDRARNAATETFLLEFGTAEARIAFDLPNEHLATLLAKPLPTWASTRWLNIWRPFQQQELLRQLARQYNFSPRLLALMCSDPRQPVLRQEALRERQKRNHRFWQRRQHAHEQNETDIESDDLTSSDVDPTREPLAYSNIYKIADDIWHYSSVDFGQRYVCVGYNSLYSTSRDSPAPNDEARPLPNCLRLWTWLLLCDNNTLITIHEDPFPFTHTRNLTLSQTRLLTTTRLNTTSIIHSLATPTLPPSNPLNLLPIRPSTPLNAPPLLFYYLFESWPTTSTLITRRESRYSTELDHLRREMLAHPHLTQIERLHTMGKELALLRRHFSSYMHIIDRLLEPPVTPIAGVNGSAQASVVSQGAHIAVVEAENQRVTRTPLRPAARVRFMRLRDLLEMYALDEVDEDIKQKDALVTMTISLIAVKQSTDVERLTRITLLLTKATMLFLPVNLMTAYFSVPLVDAVYSMSTFWGAFAVVLVASWLAMLGFGVFSGTVQAREVWRGIAGTCVGWMGGLRRGRKGREKGEEGGG